MIPVNAPEAIEPASRFTALAGSVMEMVGNKLVVRDLEECEAKAIDWAQMAKRYRYLRRDEPRAQVCERDARALAAVCDAARAFHHSPLTPGAHVRAMLEASVAELEPEPPRPAA